MQLGSKLRDDLAEVRGVLLDDAPRLIQARWLGLLILSGFVGVWHRPMICRGS